MSCEKLQSYDVIVGNEVFTLSGALCELIASRRALIVTTPTVDRLYGQRLRRCITDSGVDATVEVMSLTEHDKQMDTVLEICAAAHSRGLARHGLLVAFGGGVCCDLVTVASSLFRRGIPYSCVPTTLVGQVDAGIGLKGAINFANQKNYLGCFAPPKGVLVDPTLLISLPLLELQSGIAEILKMAIIRDETLFAKVADHGAQLIASRFNDAEGTGPEIIARSIELMLSELAPNCYEDRTLLRLVDFGHTFSPKLEELSGYHLRHGLAVALDISLSTAIAMELTLIPQATGELIFETIDSFGLPTYSPLFEPRDLQHAAEVTANHRAGALNLVVPTAIGSGTFISRLDELTPTLITAAIKRLSDRQEFSSVQGGVKEFAAQAPSFSGAR
jgi:3-dehydroquinate synthase